MLVTRGWGGLSGRSATGRILTYPVTEDELRTQMQSVTADLLGLAMNRIDVSAFLSMNVAGVDKETLRNHCSTSMITGGLASGGSGQRGSGGPDRRIDQSGVRRAGVDLGDPRGRHPHRSPDDRTSATSKVVTRVLLGRCSRACTTRDLMWQKSSVPRRVWSGQDQIRTVNHRAIRL